MKKAFTLAEVLLTLAIIGVVAALTIPAVITKVQQDQYIVGLKKAYNTLKSVQREAEQENGEMAGWSWAGDLTDFDNYFKPHFDILKDCGSGSDDGCFVDSYLYPTANTTYLSNINSNTNARLITSDGISFVYQPSNDGIIKGTFWVDVNGKKPPNRSGRDFFRFNIYASPIGIKPSGAYDKNGVVIPTETADANCKTSGGGHCATKVLSEGAMNY